MAGARKIAANRANAQGSTGPKTTQGKARSARNALRHGLSLPVLANPSLKQEVRILGLGLAGAGHSTDVLQHALWVAEAQVDLNRIRHARYTLLRQHIGDLDAGEMSESSSMSESSQAAGNIESVGNSPGSENSPENWSQPLELDPDVMDQLVKICRYERRALSRRKAAIWKLDRARQRQAKAQKWHRQPKEAPAQTARKPEERSFDRTNPTSTG